MKALKLLSATILFTSLIIGCAKLRDTAKDISMAQDNALTSQMGNDIQAIVDQSIETNIVGDLKTGEASDISGGDITIDTPNTKVTVKFATEYMGTRTGHKFMGTVIVDHNDKKYNELGFEATVTFVDFSINGNKIDNKSSLTIKNVGATKGEMTWDIVADYTIINVAGEKFTAIAKIQKSITKGFSSTSWEDNEYSMTGGMTGVSSAGDEYAVDILEPLVKTNACTFITKGILQYTKAGSKEEKTLDFGDGLCNDKASLSAYGVVKEIVLK
jgi:hypothetical protein